MTALQDHLIRRIEIEGSLSVADYMAECLGNPEHGYYSTRDPFGVSGDFTTAPEISQIYGELIGLWCAVTWQQMGSPAAVRLVELGPGRGTMMADMLRSIEGVPEFRDALSICLVETSSSLREKQRVSLLGSKTPMQWVSNFSDVPPTPNMPMIVIASEFFDALPIHQFVRVTQGWSERQIIFDEANGSFAFSASAPNFAYYKLIPEKHHQAPVGSVVEFAPLASSIMTAIAHTIANNAGAALVIDYGHGESDIGETLQAAKDHQFHDVLTDPGHADLTAHVDFSRLGQAAREAGAETFGPVEQGDFLTRIGIEARRDSLIAANSDRAVSIREGTDRLTDREKMGRLFKCLAIAAPGALHPAGFE